MNSPTIFVRVGPRRPATGEGRMHYRIGVNGTRFHLGAAAKDLGLGKPWYQWRPHGDSNPGYRRERAMS